MLTFISILLIIAALVLIMVILAQNPKGGGVSATFGGSGSQIIGARQTADFLEKATWYIAIGILVVVIGSNFFIPNKQIDNDRESIMSSQIEEMPNPIQQNPNPTEGMPDNAEDL